ncbi:hypothetical protein [Canibacter zhoujuaniae]|uniref:hypothetical protein n=1 Tax=Canibacter zhoujuaniae TaxID=2708343 RepID=UPI0014220CAF|nr:hypothetical protein [Canibacter zhoujuaniae]
MSRFSQAEINEVVEVYRTALEDAIADLGAKSARETVQAHARELVAEEDEQLADLLQQLDESDFGEPIWNLEEEILDDRLDPDFDHIDLSDSADDTGADTDGADTDDPAAEDENSEESADPLTAESDDEPVSADPSADVDADSMLAALDSLITASGVSAAELGSFGAAAAARGSQNAAEEDYDDELDDDFDALDELDINLDDLPDFSADLD